MAHCRRSRAENNSLIREPGSALRTGRPPPIPSRPAAGCKAGRSVQYPYRHATACRPSAASAVDDPGLVRLEGFAAGQGHALDAVKVGGLVGLREVEQPSRRARTWPHRRACRSSPTRPARSTGRRASAQFGHALPQAVLQRPRLVARRGERGQFSSRRLRNRNAGRSQPRRRGQAAAGPVEQVAVASASSEGLMRAPSCDEGSDAGLAGAELPRPAGRVGVVEWYIDQLGDRPSEVVQEPERVDAEPPLLQLVQTPADVVAARS